ncbi:MAG: ATP cone domain-containing protein [Chloroherpetonaceae bacterium]|nr:ATP cone domain-containing protein [Chloroherpetonaceae bacterium]
MNSTPTRDTALLLKVMKRDKSVVSFDQSKISIALNKAGNATGEFGPEIAQQLSEEVVKVLEQKFEGEIPTVEQIQDIVETVLIKENWAKTAKAYILYRNERAKIREQKRPIPEEVKKLADESKHFFRNELSELVYYRTYSRWLPEKGRRETWVETVTRYVEFMRQNLGDKLTTAEYDEIRTAILKQDIMPSMRLLWSAGEAASRTNVAAYNCSFIAPESLQDFGEIMYILMCGTGVGFSVEQQTIHRLPQIKRQTGKKQPSHVVLDSKEGWADAFVLGLNTWFSGEDISFDYSTIRPQGARLKTMGGRASGPEPLRSLIDFTRDRVLQRQGRRLTTLDVHDIICKIGEVVVMGGVRRSALISLSDLDDTEMRHAKDGAFYMSHPERSMANNSAIYNERPTVSEFLDEWLSLIKSGSGERGIFNRSTLLSQLPERRREKFERYLSTSGTNPCGEIILRSKQFCNLSEVVARSEDTEDSLLRKVRLATIVGTFQSTLTDFPYLSEAWKKNCEEERLLGVSITGQWDSDAARQASTLSKLKTESLKINQEYAKRFGINASTCITCVKPSGTVSQLVDAASGMHARHAPYYIRRIRISASDPLFKLLKDQKFPYKPEVGQVDGQATTYVLEFPVKAPDGATTRDDVSALEQLAHWKLVKTHFTEHNPSVTVSVGEEEWLEVGNWLYKNWEIIGGLSFLPRTNHVYALAPYEEVSKETYEKLAAKLPKIDFSEIVAYEENDETQGSKELACVGGSCEL